MSLYSKIIDRQKLNAAWQRVKKNKPAAGIDNVTYEQFDQGIKENLNQLHVELADHQYRALPVKIITLYKDEKARQIALYSMRDKVVQQSLAIELNKVFDGHFSDQTSAYRHEKSAMVAIEEINGKIMEGVFTCYIKLDIKDFFGSVRWGQILDILRRFIPEEDVCDLIRQNSCGTWLDMDTGDICDRPVGIYQGSIISPILSNLYLMDFDKWLADMQDIYFIRYSDDMIVLGKTREKLTDLLQEMLFHLRGKGLEINDKKSQIGKLADGMYFLGYFFDDRGKAIPKKAEVNLQNRLETLWITNGELSVEEKLEKVLEIVGGWEQYFREEREVGSIFEFAALMYTDNDIETGKSWIPKERARHINIYYDLTSYLAGMWRKMGLKQLELMEYEQYYGVPYPQKVVDGVKENVYRDGLLRIYREFFVLETETDAIEMMQLYTDWGQYGNAEWWHRKSEALRSCEEKTVNAVIASESGTGEELIYRSSSIGTFLKLFSGREDIYAREELDYRGRRKSETVPAPLNTDRIKEHLSGKATLGTYIQRPNATVRMIVFDVDVSKKVLLQHERGSREFARYLQKAYGKVTEIQNTFKKWGFESYVEYSGCRGYHLWMFLEEWIPTRYAVMLIELAQEQLTEDPDVNMEYFPDKTRIKAGKYGQSMKLPYGIHIRTGERSFFIDREGHPVFNVDEMMDSIAYVSLSSIKRVLAKASGKKEIRAAVDVPADITIFGEVDPAVSEVLIRCNLMRHLCLKAQSTGYLTHFERLSILYVFGHIGENGQRFVHQVMSYTMNYQYNTTERFIRKMPEKPISCVKLRDQYKMLTAEIGCNCIFKSSKKCYPSPVLHAILGTPDLEQNVTLPTSRTLTKKKEKEVLGEINIYAQAQDMAKRISDLKRQRRRMDRSIAKIEMDLGRLFDENGVDCLEIEMGMLTRRKKDDGYEWMIEI